MVVRRIHVHLVYILKKDIFFKNLFGKLTLPNFHRELDGGKQEVAFF